MTQPGETFPSIAARRGWPDTFPNTGAWREGDDPGARQFFALPRPLALEGGGVLPEVSLAYVTSWCAQTSLAAARERLVRHRWIRGQGHPMVRAFHKSPIVTSCGVRYASLTLLACRNGSALSAGRWVVWRCSNGRQCIPTESGRSRR